MMMLRVGKPMVIVKREPVRTPASSALHRLYLEECFRGVLAVASVLFAGIGVPRAAGRSRSATRHGRSQSQGGGGGGEGGRGGSALAHHS